MRRSRLTVALATALLPVLVAGCATIPTDGSVHRVESERSEDQEAVRYNPAGPTAGASPSQIVYGFLDAMLAYPVRRDIAKEFLTADAAQKWKPGQGAVIYSQPQVESDPAADGTVTGAEQDSRTVRLTYTTAATLDPRGRYAKRPDRETTVTWTLERVGGEWRITNPPDGVLVSEDFFENYYQQVNLYYFNSSANQLVADPVYQPRGDRLATTLLSGLLGGPDGLLAGEARTFLPDETGLEVSVPVRDDGVADVRLTGPVRELSTSEQERLAAQVVWTVRQVQGVSQVRITVNGRVLDLPGVDDEQPTSVWDRFDVTESAGAVPAFAMRNGRLVVISGTSVSEFAGPWGERRSNVADFRIDTDLERIAFVTRGRESIEVAPLSDDERTTVATGTSLLKPVWDLRGRLWVVDRTSNRSSPSTLTVIDGDNRSAVDLGPLADERITSFELSPDNARFVAIARSPRGKDHSPRLYVGAIQHGSDGETVTGVANVAMVRLADEGLTSLTAATWRSSVGVAVLATVEGGSPQPYVARIDGSRVSGGALTREPLLPEVNAQDVLSAGVVAAPLYVADNKGRLWVQGVNGRWDQLSSDPLRHPSFPG